MALHPEPAPPAFLYGTAWKEEKTEALCTQALAAGFRGFDTANQRKHYFEEGVGVALGKAIAAGTVTRGALFLQTKFTYRRGQDKRLPYDPEAPIAEQVRQSFQNSLDHLGTEYLDSYLIHGPESPDGLSENDVAVWRVMEELHDAGRVRRIGISNTNVDQVTALAEFARIKPSYVQNRCYPTIAWDHKVRDVCRRLGIVYQGFNLIADKVIWRAPALAEIARRHGKTIAQVVYKFALQVGMLPLSGTTDETHMKEALASTALVLSPADIAAIEGLNTRG